MRIAVMSDLHLEFDDHEFSQTRIASGEARFDFYCHPPQPDADVLVLAGDIHTGTLGVAWGSDRFRVPTLLVPGNHEYYSAEISAATRRIREAANNAARRVVVLENNVWTYRTAGGESARFIGTALWTDFALYGDARTAMAAAQRQLSDFKLIRIQDGPLTRVLTPADTVRLHEAACAFLQAELAMPFEGKTIVATHHAPSARSIAPQFGGHPLTPAFASDLEELIRRYEPDLWIHGHVHHSCDYEIGRTRVICNARGYFDREVNEAFDPSLVIEI